MRWKLSTALPIFIAVAVTVVLYGQLLVPGTTFVDRDISGMHLPMLTALARAAEEGVPYWNPMVHGGQPLLTNPHYATFYPPMWLAAILPLHSVIGWLVVLHVLWAFVGAWKLARYLGCEPPAAGLATLAFVGGGAFCSMPSMLNLFLGLAWMPWVILWGDQVLRLETARRWIRADAKLALALAAQILAGSPVTPVLSVLTLSCLSLEMLPGLWRRLLRLVPAGLLAIGLAAIQILPTLRHLVASARSSGLEAGMATTWSTPPIRFLELLWPRLFGDPIRVDSYLYFGYPGSERGIPLILSIYCGALVLALASGSLWRKGTPYRRALLAMVVIGCFLALGRYNPLYTKFILDIPPFSIIRFPEKFILLTTTGLAFLAALSWQGILSDRTANRDPALRGPVLLATVALIGAIFLYFAPVVAPELTMGLLEGVSPEVLSWQDQPDSPATLPDKVLMIRAGLLGKELFVSCILWTATLGLLLLHRRGRVGLPALVIATLALVGVDLGYYAWRLNNAIPAKAVLQPPAALENLPPSSGRVFSDALIFGNTVVYFPDAEAEIPSELRRSFDRLDPYTANLWGYSYALHQDPDLMLTEWARHGLRVLTKESGLLQTGWTEEVYSLLGAWNVGIVVRRRSPAAQLEERRLTGKTPAPAQLIRNPKVLPRYRFVGQIATLPDLPAAVAVARSRQFRLADFDAVVAAPAGSSIGVRTYDRQTRLVSLEEESSRIGIEYDSHTEAFLVAAITADRDWVATVDESVLPIQRTALGQMGVELPAGHRRLVLRYRNPAVVWGAILSLLALSVCGLVLKPNRMRDHD